MGSAIMHLEPLTHTEPHHLYLKLDLMQNKWAQEVKPSAMVGALWGRPVEIDSWRHLKVLLLTTEDLGSLYLRYWG